MKKLIATLGIAFLLAATCPAEAFQIHPKPHKVRRRKGRKHFHNASRTPTVRKPARQSQ